MKSLKFIVVLCFAIVATSAVFAQQNDPASKPVPPVYNVARLKKSMKIDANWEKSEWKKVKPVDLTNFIRAKPKFFPAVQAKMMYDTENIYLIFQVHDQFVRSITTEYNGNVWEDAAVEFFFAPDSGLPNSFFNLEINCGGTPLIGYRSTKSVKVDLEDLKKIEIAHSMPQKVDPEIAGPITWTLEYRIPLSMIEKYSKVTRPEKGVTWKANFYKIAENSSNPHYLTWAPITDPKASFHAPQFFGILNFQ